MGIVSHQPNKIPKGPVIAGLLFLLLTLPLAIYFVTQQQQLADLRKRAEEPGAYPPTGGGTTTLAPGQTCNPGTFDNAGTDAEVKCDTACGVHGGRMCNSSGTGYGGCQTSLHACGATSTSECNTTADCAARGYGSNVTCNITNHRCVGQSGRYFIGCGGPNNCYNCYEGSADASKNGCFQEATSCGQKSICQTQPTPSEIAQLITTQPPGGGGGDTPTPTRPPGTTPTNTPTNTPTGTPGNTPTTTAAVFCILAVLTYGMVMTPVIHAATPTPTPNAERAAARLARAKKLTLDRVAKREVRFKNLVKHFEKKKAALLPEDIEQINATITTMQSQLTEWKNAINAATTVTQIRSLHAEWIKKTRFWSIFLPRYRLLVQLGIINNGLARIDKRITNLEASYGNKRNSDKNKRYETVGTKLTEAKDSLAGIRTAIVTNKVAILALTPARLNSNPSEIRQKKQEIRKGTKTIQTQIRRSFKLLNNIRNLLKQIRNATPTPTPAS